MARARKAVIAKSPTLNEIAALNRAIIEAEGGYLSGAPGNFSNRSSLEYILEAVNAKRPIFGRMLFPTLIDKVAAVGWTIMDSHVFSDGNKRTGMAICQVFLAMNGWSMNLDGEADVIETAERTAERQMCRNAFTLWVEGRAIQHGYLFPVD